MALNADAEFMDGFDHLGGTTPNNVLQAWTSLLSGTLVLVTPGRSGITGTQALGGANLLKRTLSLSNTWDSGIAQFGFYTGSSISSQVIFQTSSAADGSGSRLSLEMNNSGFLLVRNGQAISIIATAGIGALQANTWYYIEFGYRQSTTVGTLDVKVNGVAVITFSGNTAASFTTNAFYEQIAISQTGPNSLMDDFILRTGVGTYAGGDFTGDLCVEACYPVADTADAGHAQWTPGGTPGSNHYDRVNEQRDHNGDANYVQTLTPNNIDTYKVSAPTGPPASGIGAIKFVQIDVVGRNTDATGHTITNVFHKVGGGDFVDIKGTGAFSSTFTNQRSRGYAQRPDGSGAFLVTDFGVSGAWEFGQKLLT